MAAAQNQNAKIPASGRVAIRRYSRKPISAPVAHANEIKHAGVHLFRVATRLW